MEEKNCCKINLKLFPIKSHYFFFYGGMGAVTPYLPVLGKNLGINATAVGLAYTALPFFVFLSKPAFGFITDHFRNIKLILFILVLTSLSSVFLILLPPIDNTSAIFNLKCLNDTREVHLQYNESCLADKLRKDMICSIDGGDCEFKDMDLCEASCNASTVRIDKNISKIDDKIILVGQPLSDVVFANEVNDSSISLAPLLENVNVSCRCNLNDYALLTCMKNVEECLVLPEEKDLKVVYSSYQFWVFTILAILSGTAMAVTFCLSDAACCEVLGEKLDLYGRQRLWATISWGLATLLAGYFNDLATGSSSEENFAPGFYLMLALVLIDLFILFKVQLTKANFSKNICGDVGKIFSSCESVAFATATLIIGSLTGLIWNYQFWFLQDLGATQTLLGLTVAVQCLVAEIPFFFFSGWFIEKFGHFYCLTGSFFAFALRFGFYYLLKNPWLILPIECLHGMTYALFYASMTSYASVKAPPGTEATMLGVLGGLFEGLGVAIGSLLGGVGFDHLGSRNTFMTASIISIVCTPSFAIIYIIIKHLKSSSKEEEVISARL